VLRRAAAPEHADDVDAGRLPVLPRIERDVNDLVAFGADAAGRIARGARRVGEVRPVADRDLQRDASRAAMRSASPDIPPAPLFAWTKISRFPSRPARRDGTTAITGTPAPARCSATATT